jgi:isoleucyl-tRNA synthetase
VSGAALPDNAAVVVLDTEVNADLIAEGLANDALRFIQDTRKVAGLDVSDRIILTYSADPALANAIEQHKKRIMRDALVVEMVVGDGEFNKDIEGYNLSISVKKA